MCKCARCYWKDQCYSKTDCCFYESEDGSYEDSLDELEYANYCSDMQSAMEQNLIEWYGIEE